MVLKNAQLLEQVNLSSTNPESVCSDSDPSTQTEINSLLDFDKYQQQLEENKLLRDDLSDKNKVKKRIVFQVENILFYLKHFFYF